MTVLSPSECYRAGFHVFGFAGFPAFLLSALALVSAPSGGFSGEPEKLLWDIGKRDNDNAEFALATRAYGDFREDAFFVV